MYSRRRFLENIPATGMLQPFRETRNPKGARVKAVAFDGFAIFDARSVYSLADTLFPVRGKELIELWRVRQFEYMWLRSLSRRYTDFLSITADALTFAANTLRLELSAPNRSRLMDAWLRLTCWPEAADSLRALRSAGIRTGFLSNMPEEMLEAGIRNCGLEQLFDCVLSTDRVRAYKPDPRAYHMAIEAFRANREEIAFIASAGWDAAGARAFGYPTLWVNRQNQPVEELGVTGIARGATLSDLVPRLRTQAPEPARR